MASHPPVRQSRSMSESALRSLHRRRMLLLLAGGLGTFLVSRLPGVAALEDPAHATACVAFFTAWCWLTLALPLPVSALLPAILLPASGAVSARVVAPSYFHDILLLFLGGFILALALERYGLHRRFALLALESFGVRPRRLVLGFMVVAAGLSMFISNTSTALLMLPVALAVLEDCPEGERNRLGVPLLLGMAYACSIGGTATPIGTAPNAVLLGQLRDRFPGAPQIAFGTWFLGALPFVLVMLLVTWLMLTFLLHPLSPKPLSALEGVAERRKAQGKRTPGQNRVLFVFALVALLWLTRRGIEFGNWSLPGWSSLLPAAIAGAISDSTVALFGALLFFILPGESRETGSLLGWKDCKDIPWGVLLLLGGGFALARAFESTGLSGEVGLALQPMVSALPPFALVVVVSLVVTFLTEITSNTATINVLLPLFFSAAVAARIHPLLLALPATFAVSCAFMLPVGTPPNAILFSSGRLTVFQMARAGFLLNLLAVILVSLFAVFWIAPSWGFDLGSFPDWAG